MRKKILLVFLLVLVPLALSGERAAGTNRIVPIDHAGLQRILANAECPVMVVAMAAWCRPCRAELPTLVSLYQQYRSQGLNMIGLSLDASGPAAMQPIVDKMEVPFPVYWGGDKMAFQYRINAISLIMIVNRGEITEKILGQRPKAFLEQKVNTILSMCKS